MTEVKEQLYVVVSVSADVQIKILESIQNLKKYINKKTGADLLQYHNV